MEKWSNHRNGKLAMVLLPNRAVPTPTVGCGGVGEGTAGCQPKWPPQPFPHRLAVTGPSLAPAKVCYLPCEKTQSQQSFLPSSPALYHSRNNLYQVICDLPTGERPARLSNSALPKFIYRHISLHWRSPVSSDFCAKNVGDKLSLCDNFGILPGKALSLLRSDLDAVGLNCTIPTGFESAKSNPHDCAGGKVFTGKSLVVPRTCHIVDSGMFLCANASKGQSHTIA